jgi:hypothetical protein
MIQIFDPFFYPIIIKNFKTENELVFSWIKKPQLEEEEKEKKERIQSMKRKKEKENDSEENIEYS